MKTFLLLLAFTTFGITACSQKYTYPGPLEIKSYKIGGKVDTSLFEKYNDLYFPNYLDGWTMDNVQGLPKKYKGLPIAIWTSKKDSGIVLTLLNNVILNITVSFMTPAEEEVLYKMAAQKFGGEAEKKSYEKEHPLQSWVTYWNLKTWETKDVIFQIGNSHMRKPGAAGPKETRWNLVYSDFLLEDKVIADFRKK